MQLADRSPWSKCLVQFGVTLHQHSDDCFEAVTFARCLFRLAARRGCRDVVVAVFTRSRDLRALVALDRKRVFTRLDLLVVPLRRVAGALTRHADRTLRQQLVHRRHACATSFDARHLQQVRGLMSKCPCLIYCAVGLQVVILLLQHIVSYRMIHTCAVMQSIV